MVRVQLSARYTSKDGTHVKADIQPQVAKEFFAALSCETLPMSKMAFLEQLAGPIGWLMPEP